MRLHCIASHQLLARTIQASECYNFDRGKGSATFDAEEVGTGHVSAKNADVVCLLLLLLLLFAMAVSRVLDHFSRYKQEGREI